MIKSVFSLLSLSLSRSPLALSLLAAIAAPAVALHATENTWDYAVQVSATIQESPAKITLSWPQDTQTTPTSYTVYRKAPTATSWGTGTVLSGATTSYADSTVVVGTPYEYQIVKAKPTYTGYGYIRTGIKVPVVEARGTLLLLVDTTYASDLAAELDRFQQDLVGDGWRVNRIPVSRTETVPNVKKLIKDAYNADPVNVKSVLLFGHIPVPRSGKLNPDTHAEHLGAWAADPYYVDLDGVWTDTTVNYTQFLNGDPADRERLTNVPGDGKFDQTTLPSAVDLQLGRVDLANMPGRLTPLGAATFPSEKELLRNYLNKNHKFRHQITKVQRRGVVADHFGTYQDRAFAANGYRNFSAFFGASNVLNLNLKFADKKGAWIQTLSTDDYLWAYGCGPGGYNYAQGLGFTADYFGTTPELFNYDIKSVFVLLNGSWFGDWDAEDDLLRGVLATPTYGLASGWAGNPHWYVHPMGMGETIGYCTQLTQNNTGLYKNQVNAQANSIQTALMGDPTLRMHPVGPPTAGTTRVTTGKVTVTWGASTDSPTGYHIYRANALAGPYLRVNTSAVTGTSFSDTTTLGGAQYYMVRAIKLESTPSGSYYNLSQGVYIPIVTPTVTEHPASQTIAPGGTVQFTASAIDATSYQWQLNGVNISGATGLTLTVSGLTSANAGNYTFIATNSRGSATSRAAKLLVDTPKPGKLINLSARATAGADAKALIAGFVLSSGAGKEVLARGVGPALKDFGVTGFLADPKLEVFRVNTSIGINDNWEDASGGPTITTWSTRTGAFALKAKSLDSAIAAPLGGATNYTAQVTGKLTAEGVSLAELYDASLPTDTGAPVFVNLSARAQVGTGGNILIAGFVISGNVPRQILVRGVGPTLGAFGVSGVLGDPVLEVHGTVNAVDTVLTTNDNWNSIPEVGDALSIMFSKAGAFGLPSGSSDAALAITLEPGNYTIFMSGANGSTGIGLMEIYDLTSMP